MASFVCGLRVELVNVRILALTRKRTIHETEGSEAPRKRYMQSRCESTPSPFFISLLNLSYSPQCRARVISYPASLSLSISYSNHRATPNAIRGFVCPPTSRFPCVTSILLYEVSRIYKYLNTVSPCPMPCVSFQHTRSDRARSCVQSGKLNH